jgi:cobalt/nickel transport system ATP-binding protein
MADLSHGQAEVFSVRELRFAYPSAPSEPVLRGLSFEVREGERLALVGPNGAGKSTLLMHLNGLMPDHPSRAIRAFGRALDEFAPEELRRRVGLVFQDPHDQLFCTTVQEDVEFGPRQLGLAGRELELRVRACLERVGLGGERAFRRSPWRLSGGEQKRACLAGVLACEPEVLLLDEPTGGLDPRGRRELRALLGQLALTQVIATHDLELVLGHCDRALLVDEGRLVAEGPPGELLAREELMLAHGLERPASLRPA